MTDLDRLREEYKHYRSSRDGFFTDCCDDLIAALEQRHEEDEGRIADSNAAHNQDAEHIAALEAENERLRWILRAALDDLSESMPSVFTDEAIANIMADLEYRWARREP